MPNLREDHTANGVNGNGSGRFMSGDSLNTHTQIGWKKKANAELLHVLVLREAILYTAALSVFGVEK